jgi:hypothetical protein
VARQYAAAAMWVVAPEIVIMSVRWLRGWVHDDLERCPKYAHGSVSIGSAAIRRAPSSAILLAVVLSPWIQLGLQARHAQ